jgi:CubicO group peptidase (beta-lactamase class C family)/ankyrin repeat protein
MGFIFQACSQSLPPRIALPPRIDDLINDYVAHHQFMGTVLVAEKGKVVFAKGYGLADVDRDMANTPETKFLIGSITKQFTAMLVTQLVEKGRIRLENTISDFMPEFPADIGKVITIEMLLNHASGLRLPEGIEKYYDASNKDEFLQEFIKQQSEEGLRFDPGKGYAYSNAGYYLLGLIIEKVTGKTYEEVLRGNILNPLGMADTGCSRKGEVLKNGAISYAKLPDRYVTWNEEMHSYDPGVVQFSAGYMYSTVGDLLKFSMAISSHKLLSPEYTGIFLKMRNIKSQPPIRNISRELAQELFGTCGNGFAGEIAEVEDPISGTNETFFWHDGTCKLFKAFHYHFSNNDRVIIILSNSGFICQGDEMVMKIHHLLDRKPSNHICFKHDLAQYISEEIAMHAGIPAAVDEYLRLVGDTERFIVPSPDYLIGHGRQIAEMGDLESAILILQTAVSKFPQSWQAYDALGDAYRLKKDTEPAIQSFKKSLELNPQNTHAQEVLKKLLPSAAMTLAQEIFDAVKKGYLAKVKEFVEKDANQVHAKNHQGDSLLNYACNLGHLEIINFLVDKGADIDLLSGRLDLTPLMVCARTGNLEVAKLLVERGADVQIINHMGISAMHWALGNGQNQAEEIALLLIEVGSKVKTKAFNGETPVMTAVRKGYAKAVKALLEKGADPLAVDQGSQQTLLHKASILGYGGIAGLLVDYGVDVNAKDAHGNTALFYAYRYGNKSVAEVLNAASASKIKIEEMSNPSKILKGETGRSEAYIWRMNTRGWTVKTRSHLIVFNNEYSGLKPDNPCLSNGFIEASEIADQNILALYTAYHAKPYTKEFINGLEDELKNIVYVHYDGDATQGNRNEIHLKGYGEATFGHADVSYFESDYPGMGWLAYLIKVDGLTIYYSGWLLSALDEYKKEIDYFASQSSGVDIAFVWKEQGKDEYYKYLLDKLKPRLFFPDGEISQNIEAFQKLIEPYQDTQLGISMNPGDRFHYKKGK